MMKTTIRQLILFALLLGTFGSSIPTMAQPTASTAAEVLRKSADKLRNAPSVEASFTAVQGNHSSTGNILLSGNRFAISTPELSTWFDGKTQWAYAPSAGEVNISEPTPEELQQINPFAILSAMLKNFSPRRLKSAPGTDKIELTPKGKSEYLKVVAVFNSTTSFPKEIVITASDRTTTSITINSIKQGGKPAAGKFRFNANSFPGVEVIDLR